MGAFVTLTSRYLGIATFQNKFNYSATLCFSTVSVNLKPIIYLSLKITDERGEVKYNVLVIKTLNRAEVGADNGELGGVVRRGPGEVYGPML
jgi:hypothetical protein